MNTPMIDPVSGDPMPQVSDGDVCDRELVEQPEPPVVVRRGLTLREFTEAMREQTKCPRCGKSTLAVNIAAPHQRFRADVANQCQCRTTNESTDQQITKGA